MNTVQKKTQSVQVIQNYLSFVLLWVPFGPHFMGKDDP